MWVGLVAIPSNTVRFMELCLFKAVFVGEIIFQWKKNTRRNTGEVSQYPRVLPVVRWSEDRLRHTLGAPGPWELRHLFLEEVWGNKKHMTCQHGSLIPNKHQDSWETVKETNGDEGLGIMKEGWFSHVWIPSSKWWMIVWHFGIYNVSMFQKIFVFQYVHTCKSCKYQWPQLKKSPSGAVNCIPSCWVFST